MTAQDLTLIAGTWRDSADGATFDRISPAHGAIISPERRAQAGMIWTKSRMDGFVAPPSGGVKERGQERELGRYGLDEFLEVNTVQMRIGRTRAPWVDAP